MSAHSYRGVVVVNGVCHESGVRNGKHYSVRMRFTNTWIRRCDNWVCVASPSRLIGR
jgi:hypothetical protein